MNIDKETIVNIKMIHINKDISIMKENTFQFIPTCKVPIANNTYRIISRRPRACATLELPKATPCVFE